MQSLTLRKLPTELIRSCGTGIYLKTSDIRGTQPVFEKKQISVRGIYEIRVQEHGRKICKKYKLRPVLLSKGRCFSIYKSFVLTCCN